MTISEDEIMVSFGVVSLFTAIPVDKACTYIRTKLENDNILSDRTQLDIDDILRLLQFVLFNSFSFTMTQHISKFMDVPWAVLLVLSSQTYVWT